jgi:riboflavin synthase alpha subunit
VFSGIVQAVGVVEEAQAADGALRLRIAAELPRELAPGDSVAVNGVCLTVERAIPGALEVTAVAETLRATTLGALAKGRRVNLEPALRVGDPLGGHWVLGHVDAVARVRSVDPRPGETRVAVEIPPGLRRYVAPKGSVTIDGVSLTVAAWSEPVLEVALVPFTLEHTTLGALASGDEVNLEADLVARYLDRLLDARAGSAPRSASGSGPGAATVRSAR